MGKLSPQQANCLLPGCQDATAIDLRQQGRIRGYLFFLILAIAGGAITRCRQAHGSQVGVRQVLLAVVAVARRRWVSTEQALVDQCGWGA